MYAIQSQLTGQMWEVWEGKQNELQRDCTALFFLRAIEPLGNMPRASKETGLVLWT